MKRFLAISCAVADTTLFNEASQVIMARDGKRTVISMQNDYQGPLEDFAMVVPVPEVLKREQVNAGDRKIFERIDAYSAPRLAEYYDPDPCARASRDLRSFGMVEQMAAPVAQSRAKASDKDLGVAVEAKYTVGEYDIVMLSATQSDGLETWLQQNGYRIPKGASKALQPYIRQGLKFFVAKVNLKEAKRLYGASANAGATRVSATGSPAVNEPKKHTLEPKKHTLAPLQFAFESERFMLPVRLGMINANGPQDLVVYMLTRNGRVESTNYRTLKLPANMDLPTQLRGDFAKFYKALFDKQAESNGYRTVFTEYFWDMSWCDPCAANPLSDSELRSAGVFWLAGDPATPDSSVKPSAGQAGKGAEVAQVARPGDRPFVHQTRFPMPSGAQPVMLTRLHVRYTKETFPEDISFQETSDKQNYQTRYVIRHAYNGSPSDCPAAKTYYEQVAKRKELEARTLAGLTGWPVDSILQPIQSAQPQGESGWWRGLWRKSDSRQEPEKSSQ
jgi:hypothetical protein